MTMQKFVGIVCFIVVFGPVLLLLLFWHLIHRQIRRNRKKRELSKLLDEYEAENNKWRDDFLFQQFCLAHGTKLFTDEEIKVMRKACE